MGIVWLILKIIGITLLVILGLVLFLVLVVLITPFRYQVNASYHDEPYAEVKFHFWLRAVVARVTFKDKKLLGILRILFIKKKLMEKDFGKKGEVVVSDGHVLPDQSAQLLADAESFAENMDAQAESQTEEGSASPDAAVSEDKPEENIKADNASEPETISESEEGNAEGPSEEDASAETSEAEIAEEAGQAEDTQTGSGIEAKIESIKAKGQQIAKTVTEKKEMVDRYVDFATQEHTKRAAKYVGKKLVKVLKSIRPRKCKGELKLGLKDPKTMGMICGYSGMFYPVYYKAIDFQPVFGADHTVIDGEIEIKGRIILMAIVVRAVPILFKKDCRRVWKDFKKLRKH